MRRVRRGGEIFIEPINAVVRLSIRGVGRSDGLDCGVRRSSEMRLKLKEVDHFLPRSPRKLSGMTSEHDKAIEQYRRVSTPLPGLAYKLTLRR